jgi:hypothetical protein
VIVVCTLLCKVLVYNQLSGVSDSIANEVFEGRLRGGTIGTGYLLINFLCVSLWRQGVRMGETEWVDRAWLTSLMTPYNIKSKQLNWSAKVSNSSTPFSPQVRRRFKIGFVHLDGL